MLVGGEQGISQKLHKDITDYILSRHCFDSAIKYSDSFNTHIRRLAEAGQIALYTRGSKITGIMGWMWIDDILAARKTFWATPEEIINGKILYISFAALDKGVKIYDVLKLLRKEANRRGTKEVRWANFKHNEFKIRRINRMNNCGISALSKIKELKGVSAFTLIHLGKDNGVDLKLFKVKDKDLPLVHRPAIFHSENHFEFIKNGEPLPDQKWTGYVLTQKSIGRPISHKEAKTISGEGPIAAIVGGIISAVTGAVSATIGAVGAVAQGAGALASGLGVGAAGPLTQAGTAIAGGLKLGAAGALGGAALAGATGQPVGAGAAKGALIGAGVGAGGAFGGAAGLTGRQVGGTLAGAVGGAAGAEKGQRLAGALKGGATGFTAGTLAQTFLKTGGEGLTPLTGGPGTAVEFARRKAAKAGTDFSLSNIGFSPGTLGELGKAVTAGTLATGAKAFGPKGPETVDFDPTAEFSTLRGVLGTQGLPPAAESEILRTVNTPIADLAKEFGPVSDRTIRRINEAFDSRDQQLRRAFAQSGQNEQTSSELRNELQRSRLDRATALGEAEQESFNTGISRAIQSKQFALNQSIQANQFDVTLALELADMIGSKAALEAAIQQNDENQFNTLIAQILNIGFGGQDTDLNRIQSSLR